MSLLPLYTPFGPEYSFDLQQSSVPPLLFWLISSPERTEQAHYSTGVTRRRDVRGPSKDTPLSLHHARALSPSSSPRPLACAREQRARLTRRDADPSRLPRRRRPRRPVCHDCPDLDRRGRVLRVPRDERERQPVRARLDGLRLERRGRRDRVATALSARVHAARGGHCQPQPARQGLLPVRAPGGLGAALLQALHRVRGRVVVQPRERGIREHVRDDSLPHLQPADVQAHGRHQLHGVQVRSC